MDWQICLKDWSINIKNNVITLKNSQGKLKYHISLIDPTTIPKVLKWINVKNYIVEYQQMKTIKKKLSSYRSK